MAGLTSSESAAAQSGAIELVTTDANGNLASDGGALQGQVNTNSSNIQTNADAIQTNSNAILSNSDSITSLQSGFGSTVSGVSQNSAAIALNSDLISVNTTAIGQNTAAIALNSGAISELREGTASLASIPDLYLNKDETWTIAGGLGAYDDGYGGAEVAFGGGLQLRSSTEDRWSVGVAAGLSKNTQVVRLQARFGG